MSTCSICMDSQINVIFNGCHHACCCQACADRLIDSRSPECPVCRAKLVVDGSQEIYSLFYLNGVLNSPSSEGESKSDSESELRDKLSEQSKKICELQQLQSMKQQEATKVESPPHRRPTGYQLFVREFTSTSQDIDIRERFSAATRVWKALPDSAKQIWYDEATPHQRPN